MEAVDDVYAENVALLYSGHCKFDFLLSLGWVPQQLQSDIYYTASCMTHVVITRALLLPHPLDELHKSHYKSNEKNP